MANKDNNQTSETNESAEDRLAAVIALLADNEAPIGAKPDLKEIQDWLSGKLNSQRAMEVKSHVARDPDCYQMLSDLHAADNNPPATANLAFEQSFAALLRKFKSSWHKPLSSVMLGGGLATAIVVIIVMVLPFGNGLWSPLDNPILARPDVNWPFQTFSIARNSPISRHQEQAFKVGIREGIAQTTQGKHGWGIIINTLPAQLPDCQQASSASLCEQQIELLNNIGIHAGVNYLACLDAEQNNAKRFTQNYWSKQKEVWPELAKQAQEKELELVAQRIKKISGSKSTQCSALRNLLRIGFE